MISDNRLSHWNNIFYVNFNTHRGVKDVGELQLSPTHYLEFYYTNLIHKSHF